MAIHLASPEKALPISQFSEQMLLGGIILNTYLLNSIQDDLFKAEYFYFDIHKSIYKAIEVLLQKELILTPQSLSAILKDDESFIEMGSVNYLNEIVTSACLVIEVQSYAKIIRDSAMKRNLIEICENTIKLSQNSTIEIDSKILIDQADNSLSNLRSFSNNDGGFVEVKYSFAKAKETIDLAIKRNSNLIGISTGIPALDYKLLGFQKSDLIILGGRPSMGKTAFAIHFALSTCEYLKSQTEEENSHVGFFSLEMSSEQIATRILLAKIKTNVDSNDVRLGKISEDEYNKLQSTVKELSSMQMIIDDTPGLTIAALKSRARRAKLKYNLKILFIDYLQLINGKINGATQSSKVHEISEITQALKGLAKELDIPIIALSQLSRAVESREDKRPGLSDLRESGSIEQDADIVMFLYREEYYLSRKEPSLGDAKHAEWRSKLEKVHNITDVIVAKHRNGEIGTVKVVYNPERSLVTERN